MRTLFLRRNDAAVFFAIAFDRELHDKTVAPRSRAGAERVPERSMAASPGEVLATPQDMRAARRVSAPPAIASRAQLRKGGAPVATISADGHAELPTRCKR